MGAVTKLLERFGFVRLRDFGLVLTPDRRIVPWEDNTFEPEPANALPAPAPALPPQPSADDGNHWDGEDEWEWEIAVARARAAATDEPEGKLPDIKPAPVRPPPKLMPLPEALASGSNTALPRTIIPVPSMPIVDPALVRPAARLARASNPPPPPRRRRAG